MRCSCALASSSSLHYVYVSCAAWCPDYTNRSEPWRNVGFCSSSCNMSDSNLQAGWYRFTGIGGDQVVSSCAQYKGNFTNYNLFACDSNISITPCSGFTLYYLQPTSGTYATREKNLLALHYPNLSGFSYLLNIHLFILCCQLLTLDLLSSCLYSIVYMKLKLKQNNVELLLNWRMMFLFLTSAKNTKYKNNLTII